VTAFGLPFLIAHCNLSGRIETGKGEQAPIGGTARDIHNVRNVMAADDISGRGPPVPAGPCTGRPLPGKYGGVVIAPTH
jgi:hypothetical protein